MNIQCGDHAQYEIDNSGVPKEERSDWPWPSFDAMNWAKALSKQFGMPVDSALPWCASMLMRGYDEKGFCNQWIQLSQQMPEPRVFVLCWDGRKAYVDCWVSEEHDGNGATHWMPFPQPPGGSNMYDGERLRLSARGAEVG